MDYSAFDARQPSEPTRATDEASQGEEVLGRDLLEQVLRQTLNGAAPKALDPSDLEALRGVARRHRGEPLVLEPTTVELIHAVLCAHFPKPFASGASGKAMSAEIAQTLFEDPTSRRRLEALWKQLTELDQ